MLRIAILAFIGCTLGTVATAEQYICLAEQATGFIKKDGKWEMSRFIADFKFLINFSSEGLMSVTQFGESDSLHDEAECTRGTKVGRCADIGGQFIINLDTMRFTNTFILGYVDDSDRTPLVMIGTCSKL